MTDPTHRPEPMEGLANKLHRDVMNLPCNVPAGYPYGSALCVGVYEEGHRHARHAAAKLISAAFAEVEATRSAMTQTVVTDALRELLQAEEAAFPLYEAGKDAQDAWANRRGNARNAARAILAAQASQSQPPPHECKTEAEKRAWAFGYWEGLEALDALGVASVSKASDGGVTR